jgi:hypothetical protein
MCVTPGKNHERNHMVAPRTKSTLATRIFVRYYLRTTMKFYLLIFLASIGFCCCDTKDKTQVKPGEIAIKDLRLNEIVHDSLTVDQLRDIEKIHKSFAEVNSSSLEETITNFKRDRHPDDEIAIWLKMAEAYERFTLAGGRQIDLNKKNEVYQLILLRSMMSEREVMDQVKVTSLTDDEIKEVFSYYDSPPKPLKIEKE